MRRAIGLLMTGLALPATAAAAQGYTLPSSQVVELIDVIVEEEPPTVRFRFLAPSIDPAGAALSYEEVHDDFLWLCENAVLPALQDTALTVGEVVISLHDRPVEFGVAAPEATQYFEPFTVEDGRCIWEQF